MKLPKRESSLFGMAFLDVISCGFGAIVLLVLISRPGLTPDESPQDMGALLARTFRTESELKQLNTLLERLKLQLAENVGSNQDALLAQQRIGSELKEKLARMDRLSADILSLHGRGDQLREIQLNAEPSPMTPEEIGGIPVDSDYIVFVVDQSGSMQFMARRVLSELDKVLSSHPQVKKFQVMSDDGDFVFGNSSWIDDTPANRKRALAALNRWFGSSDSNPVDGIQKALNLYRRTPGKMALYVFGDDFSGNSFDAAVAAIDRANRKDETGAKVARIHAVAFYSGFSGDINMWKFSTLMHAVANRHDGTFIGLAR